SLRLDPRAYCNWMELGVTNGYLNRYEAAFEALERARRLDPDSFWAKMTLARLYLQKNGDAAKAVAAMVGAQHTIEYETRGFYVSALVLARRFDEALELAASWPAKWEQQRQRLILREASAAEILHFAGRASEAHEQAQLALGRLEQMKLSMPDDYRIYTPVAKMLAILGDAQGCVAAVEKTLQLKPADAVTDMQIRYQLARSLAIAGEQKRATEMLNSLIPPPTVISVPFVELDPAFDGIRDDPAFTKMLDRHRGEAT
ncbi:MAG: hypothetical protein IIA76_07365, partial [Proteobacteria bacterium]|nr:hypothetical protein [Pseudomonadota bacterium]